MSIRWARCPDGGGFYQVSDHGDVRRVMTQRGRPCLNRPLKPSVKHGYEQVCLSVHNRKIYRPVHRLVAIAFIGAPPSTEHQVNHIDADKRNNYVDNLEWCTAQENVQHARKMGLRDGLPDPPTFWGEDHPIAKLTRRDVREIRWWYSQKRTQRDIGAMYGVSKATVGTILRGEGWSHVRGMQKPGEVA